MPKVTTKDPDVDSTYSRDILLELRSMKMYRMRIQGYTIVEIADELKCAISVVSTTLKRLMDELKALSAQEADAYRAYELTRLDNLFKSLQPKIEEGDVNAVNSAVRVIERRCKMLGIDAPQEIKIDDGGELREKLLAMLGD